MFLSLWPLAVRICSSPPTTQRNSIHRSIRADVSIILFEFEVRNVNVFVWIPGANNLADPGTKQDSSITDGLQPTLSQDMLPLDFIKQESKQPDRPLG